MQPETKANVLLVDDRPENLIALEAVLDSIEQNLVKANSGQEALRCLLNQDFAVILLDVNMPGMDGFETATLIRNRERSRHTPIIFLTADNSSDTRVSKGYSLGAVDFLFKPLNSEILSSKVAVFVELFKKTEEVKRQTRQLQAINGELRASEERFRCLSACSPVGIILTDIEGRCTYTNPRCQAICGFTLEESLGDGWLHSIHPEDRQQVLTEWGKYTREGREYSNELRFFSSEGIICWTHVHSSSMLSDGGELIGYVVTIEDITGRKQAEEERATLIREQEARRQAEAANRKKDEFLATLSHELRTPLNSMLGWARLLRTREFDPATTAKALETIERNAKLQAQLIEDILDVSRIIQGKLRINLHPTQLIPIIEAAIDSVSLAAQEKKVQLITDLDAYPDLVNGDLARLQQVIWNLLTNAIKFTPVGGKIKVQLEVVGSEAHLQVSDTGIGISAEFLPFIFDRFRQADSTTTRAQGGLGLGLAIVHHLMELLGGTIHAESEGEGHGATFTVKLPLLLHLLPSNCVSSNLESRSNLPSLDKLQVLIADDNNDTHQHSALK